MPIRASPNKGTPWIEGHTLMIPNHEGVIEQTIRLGTSLWEHWLALATKFYVKHPAGNFFCRKETRARGSHYWLAYRRSEGKLYKQYLGKDSMITSTALTLTAQHLTALAHPTPSQGDDT